MLSIVKIIFAILSVIMYAWASVLKRPEAPKKEDPIKADYFQEMATITKRSSCLNAWGSGFMALSLFFEILQLYIKK